MNPRAGSLAGLWVPASLLVSVVALAQPPAAKAKVQATNGYARAVQRWHAPSDEPVLVDAQGRPELVLSALNSGERVELRAVGEKGGFGASDLDRAAIVLRDTRTGDACPIEPRLLDVAYAIETHFTARELRIVSGYRAPRKSGGSNHGKGRAIDLVVPGANDADVAAYARTLGFVGVGIYPTSGFVHVDLRERSYFWSDSSGPGRRNRERGILATLATSSDKDAIARGGKPPLPPTLGFDVDDALRSRGGPVRAAPSPPPDDEDDEEETRGNP